MTEIRHHKNGARLTVPDLGTLRSDVAKPHVSPFVIVRYAGLPATVLSDLAVPNTLMLLGQATELERQANELGYAASELLYQAVPMLDNKTDRRTIVQLRRDIYNLRRAAAVKRIDSVRDRVPSDVVSILKQWSDSVAEAEAAWQVAEQMWDGEISAASLAIRRHLSTDPVAGGLALASTQFAARLAAGPLGEDPNAKSVRSATAYLARVSAKTSPFSSLTTVAIGRFEDSQMIGGSRLSHRRVTANRTLATAIFLACIENDDYRSTMDVVCVEGLWHHTGRPFAVLTTRSVRGSIALRVDELTECSTLLWALDRLPRTPTRFADFMNDSGLTEATARRLLEIGILQPVVPWELSTHNDFEKLATWARDRTPSGCSSFTDALEELDSQYRILASETRASSRIDVIENSRIAVHQAFSSLGVSIPSWAETNPVFHETISDKQMPVIRMSADIKEDLVEIGRALVPWTWRDSRYDRLVELFVNRHGDGASGVSLLEFLYAALSHGQTLVNRPPVIDYSIADDPGRLVGAGTLGAAAHTVFFQMDSGPDHDRRIVVNTVHSGGSGHFARWSTVPSIAQSINQHVVEWIRSCFPAASPYQVCPLADWSDIQRPIGLGFPRVRLPGDLPDIGDTATLETMTVAHDQATHTLQVHTADHQPVAFVNTCPFPEPLLSGVPGLLSLLSNPWITIGRVDRDRAIEYAGRENPTYVPRLQRGRVVWARARWSFQPTDIPKSEAYEHNVQFLAAARQWRELNGMPHEVYVTWIRRKGVNRYRKEKPQWVGFDYPHSIWNALSHLPDDLVFVDVTEALPHRMNNVAVESDSFSSPRVCEYVAAVRCE